MVDVVCVVGGEGGIFYLDWGVWRGTPLEVVGDNHSPAPIYVCSGILWCLTGTWSFVLVICLRVWCLCLVLVALWLYGKSGAWRTPDARGEWPL